MSQLLDPAALLWLFLVALGVVLARKRARLAGWLLLILCAAWWLTEVTALPARLLSALEKPYLGATPGEGRAFDAIVVLGGGAGYSTNEFAGLDFGLAADRVLTGVDLARRGLGKNLVLGGSARIEPELAPEPELLHQWVDRWDLTKVPMISLGYCRNTREEAVKTDQLAQEHGWQRILLVTSAYHLKRSEAAFRAVNVEAVPVGCDFVGTAALQNRPKLVPQSGSMVLFQIWLHEVVGAWYYRLRGWAR